MHAHFILRHDRHGRFRLAAMQGKAGASLLRRRTESGLGPRFDVKAFQAYVLNIGDPPLPVLESKIDAWIAAGR